MAYFSSLNRYKDFGLLIIRVGLGATFIYHGYPKLIGGPESWAGLGSSTKYVGKTFLPVMWGLLAALVETVGGVLVINLIVAAATHFGKGDGISGAAHAIEDAIIFAGLFFVGPGSYSVDKR